MAFVFTQQSDERISGSTSSNERSAAAPDRITGDDVGHFTSLKKTCKKRGIACWDFILDRLRLQQMIPFLPNLLVGNTGLLKTS